MRQKIFLLFALLCAVVQGAWAQNFDVWDGVTETKPQEIAGVIYIKKASDLAYLRKHFRDYIWNEHNEVNTGISGTTHHIAYNSAFELPISLQADIDMGDAVSWVPLGWAERTGWTWSENHYEGTFNGNGHTIRIHIKDVTDNYQGLFSGIASTGRVENLHVVADIHCSSSRLVGGIAGENDGTIENCWVSGTVRSDWQDSGVAVTGSVGGIAGENNGTIQFCCMAGDVTNNDADVGGLVGNNDGILSHCTFYGTRTSSHSQDSKYVGDTGTTEEYLYDTFSLDEYNAASGKDMYRHAIRYTYDVTVNIEGHGTICTRALDEDDVPGTCAGQTFSLNVTSGTALNVTVTDADGNNIPLQGHANDNSSFWFVMPSKNVTATVTFGYTDWPTQGAGTVNDPYIISSADDWYDFAHNVTIGRSYSGKYVKLTSDISVTKSAGGYQTDDNCQPFSGTFDGDGHKLTLNVSNQSRFAAPFKCVNGATIKNLRTAGTISGTGNADGKLLAGIVGVSFGNTTITNCVSSVTLTTAFGTDAALAGLVAGTKGGSLTVSGCVFDGSMTGATNTRCAGISGYEYGGTTTTITNTLFAPATLTVSIANDGYTKTFTRDPDATITNCYYTRVLGAAQGTEAVALNEAPANLGALVQDYGMVKTYEHGILFDGIYYMDYNYAPTLPMLSDANAEDIGKVVCAAGHLHPAKIAVPDGCTAVGILGNLTADGHGLIIALQDATSQTWNTINGWTSVTTYAGTTLKLLPDGTRGSLTSITKLGSVAVSNWCVAQKSDYEAIFINFGSTTRGTDGTTYDHNVNAYITGAGGTALDGMYWSASGDPSQEWGVWFFSDLKWGKYIEAEARGVRPVLGFNITICNLSGTGTEDDPYLIGSTDDWNNFAAVVSGGNTFSGKFVKLTSDISVSTMAGASDANSFQGTFDGDGHTLTLNMSDFTEQYLAPFRYVGNATIKNLKTAGTRSTSGQYAGGLIANIVNGSTVSIEGCVSSVTISSTSYTNSGFVSRLGDNSQLTIRGCAFVGSLEGSESRNNAGFVGYCQSGSTATIEDCLFAPDHISTGLANCQTFVRGDATWLINRCYYTQAYGTEQGRQAVSHSTVPTGLGDPVHDYGMVKAYQNGILVGGAYYVAPATVTLADNADNSTTISNANGYVADVTLSGRTLYKDGAWNTICLPFDVTIAGSPLAGATARPLTSASIEGTTLTLTFGDAVTTLEAGTPYIIKWTADANYVDDDAHNIVSPVFSGVTIDADADGSYDTETASPAVTTDERVRFLGTYKSTAFDAEDKSILFLGAANKLYYPQNGASLGAQRAYFKIGEVGGSARQITDFEIDFGEQGTQTVIGHTDITDITDKADAAWYSLDGRKLEGKPTKKGVYIHNGRVVVK